MFNLTQARQADALYLFSARLIHACHCRADRASIPNDQALIRSDHQSFGALRRVAQRSRARMVTTDLGWSRGSTSTARRPG